MSNDKYIQFFLNASAALKFYDLLEISHPNFSQTFYIVRNAPRGITVTHEDSTSHNYVYYPLRVTGVGDNQTLDQILQVQLGDLGSLLPDELDRVAAANGFLTKPACIYRGYRSDDLLAPMLGPIRLEITSLTHTTEGAAFEANAPSVNQNRTGEEYTVDRFPMLRGFFRPNNG